MKKIIISSIATCILATTATAGEIELFTGVSNMHISLDDHASKATPTASFGIAYETYNIIKPYLRIDQTMSKYKSKDASMYLISGAIGATGGFNPLHNLRLYIPAEFTLTKPYSFSYNKKKYDFSDGLKVGFAIGIGAELYLDDQFSISIEGKYSLLGNDIDSIGYGAHLRYKF